MTDLLKEKTLNEYPENVQEIFELISYDNIIPNVKGSANNKNTGSNAGDYDLFSKINLKSKTINEVKNEIWENFKKTINDIMSNDDTYFIDFKCGLDDELYQDLDNVKQIHKFYKSKSEFIEPDVLEDLLRINDFEELFEFCRKLYTLRWQPKEILDGKLILYPNRDKLFVDALKDKTIIKIDVISYVNDIFTEFSNIFEFSTNKYTLSSSEYISNVIEDLFYYIDHGMTFKALKRFYSLSKIAKNEDIIKQLIELFNSDLGTLYKVLSNLNTLLILLEDEYYPRDDMITNLQILKKDISNIHEFPIKHGIYGMIDDISKVEYIDDFHNSIGLIIDYLQPILERHTLKWLKKRSFILQVGEFEILFNNKDA